MARPSKTSAIDFTAAHDLTHGLLERATCPINKPFVLLKDAEKKDCVTVLHSSANTGSLKLALKENCSPVH